MTRITAGTTRDPRVSPPPCRNGIGLGTGVFTSDGELPVEYLEPGDRIVTYDRGYVRLAGVDVRMVPASDALRLRPSVLDPDGNGRDVILSTRQQVLVRDWRARIMWNRPLALVEARRLVDGAHLARLSGSQPVRLFQLRFDDRQHLIEIAGGTILLASARMPARAAG